MKQKVFLFVLCLTLLLSITPVSAQQSNEDTNSNSNFITIDTWKGTMFYEYYSIPDLAWVYTYRYYDGENRIETVKANEYWSRYNSTNNTSASTPALPTTQP